MYQRSAKPGLVAIDQIKEEVRAVLGEENITRVLGSVVPSFSAVASVWSRVLIPLEDALDDLHADYFPQEVTMPEEYRYSPFRNAKDYKAETAVLSLLMQSHDLRWLRIASEDGEYFPYAPDDYLSGIVGCYGYRRDAWEFSSDETVAIGLLFEEKDQPRHKSAYDYFLDLAQNVLEWYQDTNQGTLFNVSVCYSPDVLHVSVLHLPRVPGAHPNAEALGKGLENINLTLPVLTAV